MPHYYSAREAAERLGVSRQTLYSYVSRGLLRAHAAEQSRERRYLVEEVAELKRRRALIRKPGEVAKGAIDWGLPVVESSICLIENGRLRYRGIDVLTLLDTSSVEEVAALLWNCPMQTAFASRPPKMTQRPSGTTLLTRFAQTDAENYGDLVRIMAACLLRRSPSIAPLHEQCARAWQLGARQSQLIRKVLILCADHELNASSFVVRCIASTDASLHACLLGGLAALSGARHGGTTHRIEALWDELVLAKRPEALVQARLARGEDVPGFGHPLYPEGDVRAAALLSAMTGRNARWQRYVASVEQLTGQRPTIDFALVALRRYLRLPEGSAFGLFALGRSIGWIAHALEERQRGRLIRPRAAYVGPK